MEIKGENRKKFSNSKILMRLASVSCVGIGLSVIAAKPVAAAFQYCDWPTGIDITYDGKCAIDGYCTTYEQMQGGACAATINPCSGCVAFTIYSGVTMRDGICQGGFSCVHNPNATGTYMGQTTIPGCGTQALC